MNIYYIDIADVFISISTLAMILAACYMIVLFIKLIFLKKKSIENDYNCCSAKCALRQIELIDQIYSLRGINRSEPK